MSAANYIAVIGLEVHCQLETASKMFSPCPVVLGGPPNTAIDAYTLGLPGTLPVANAAAVEAAIKLALAVGARVQPKSRWARKHYFYPDLPKGYQITQSDDPYALGGQIVVPGPRGHEAESTTVTLTRIHMEEDAGKNVHLVGEPWSLVDYNRAGAPLVEIVSEPDLRSADEAARYLRCLREIVRYLGISQANMEEGTLRCDANVSLMVAGARQLGTRCEIKNLNSFRFLQLAIEAEIRRQRDLIERGKPIISATLSYDVDHDRTRIMRTKEEAADYRYFPEPDMPPLQISAVQVAALRASIPELPAARRARYQELGISAKDAGVLTASRELSDYFNAATTAGGAPVKVCHWITGELLAALNRGGQELGDIGFEPAWLAELIALVDSGTLSGRAAKEVFAKAFVENLPPGQIVTRDGYRQVRDTAALEAIIHEIFARSPKQLSQYYGGREQIRGYFVGQVMKQTRGQADPKLVQKLLAQALKDRSPT